MTNDDRISMVHGSGGRATNELIDNIFAQEFNNDILSAMEDSAVVEGSGRIAITTDSFVVTPLQFPGGDIGRLSVCGTVNDLLMRGAVPRYLTCGYIIEEGLPVQKLKEIAASMAKTAREAGVAIVAGDTKVVEGKGGLYINTAGVGFVPEGREVSSRLAQEGDVIIVSGNLGDHHAAILAERLNVETSIKSDCAPLGEMVEALFSRGVHVHCLRDVTRGGLATVLKELAQASGKTFTIEDAAIPVWTSVRDFCAMMGLDPLYMGNEGKLVAIVPAAEQEQALAAIRSSRYGANAAVIGSVEEAGSETDTDNDWENVKQAGGNRRMIGSKAGEVIVRTRIGGLRRLDVLQDEGLPRIC